MRRATWPSSTTRRSEVRIRVEHEDNAITMGRVAGRNMAGRREPYHHLPYFYSDLFELGYEAVGELDARLETLADWKEPIARGSSITCRRPGAGRAAVERVGQGGCRAQDDLQSGTGAQLPTLKDRSATEMWAARSRGILVN